jgi:hypothetical protein
VALLDTIDALRAVADAAADLHNHSRLVDKMQDEYLQHLATRLRDAGYDDLKQAYYDLDFAPAEPEHETEEQDRSDCGPDGLVCFRCADKRGLTLAAPWSKTPQVSGSCAFCGGYIGFNTERKHFAPESERETEAKHDA